MNFEYGLYQPLVLPTFDGGGHQHLSHADARPLLLSAASWRTARLTARTRSSRATTTAACASRDRDWTDCPDPGHLRHEQHRFTARRTASATASFRSRPGLLVLPDDVRFCSTASAAPTRSRACRRRTAASARTCSTSSLPIFWDKTVTGANDYENVRGGVQIWTKLIGEGIGGTTFLVTAGVDYQYFYRIQKGLVMGQVAIRMGWGDL